MPCTKALGNYRVATDRRRNVHAAQYKLASFSGSAARLRQYHDHMDTHGPDRTREAGLRQRRERSRERRATVSDETEASQNARESVALLKLLNTITRCGGVADYKQLRIRIDPRMPLVVHYIR